MSASVKINKLGKFDLNPRGNLWLKDENRFGHKLLSKMGWSQGKGLGKNENGITENLKVKAKRESTGVGWSEKVYFAEENEEYDAVLANLNQKFNSPENKSKEEEDFKSIELRSQQFKNRMHYGKFVRGKDVCRYSEKDMNCIFVTKKPKPEPSFPVKSTVTNIGSSSDDDDSQEEKPIYKKSTLSVKEYFEMKMKKLKSGTDSNNATKLTNTEEAVNEEVLSRKKKKNQLDTEVMEASKGEERKHCSNPAETENIDKSSTKSRKRSKTIEITRFTPIESDDEVEASLDVCKSPENPSTLINENEEPGEVVSKVSKKRKRENGKTKPEKRKKLKSEVMDLSEESSSDSHEIELQSETSPPSDAQVSDKKRKKLEAKKSKKTKLGKLEKLKSCLKGSVSYSLKQPRRVSFNDKVFYRTINSDSEDDSTEELNFEDEVNLTDNSDFKSELCDGEACSDTLNTDEQCNVELKEDAVQSCSDTSHPDEPCNVDDVPACMKLPKCDSNNYNCWLENQRIAIKMKVYKNMIKEIRKHPILMTSNMLDLKGYGNWGL